MKKIMFNDRYGLEYAVLRKLKDLTRRMFPKKYAYEDFVHFEWNADGSMVTAYRADGTMVDIKPKYKVGDVVAVAQRYYDIYNGLSQADEILCMKSKGWRNKMFVRADLMPHQIRFTNIRIERLQDISAEDCLREGVQYDDKYKYYYIDIYGRREYIHKEKDGGARASFGYMFEDMTKDDGTWERNPWVFVYEFELIK